MWGKGVYVCGLKKVKSFMFVGSVTFVGGFTFVEK